MSLQKKYEQVINVMMLVVTITGGGGQPNSYLDPSVMLNKMYSYVAQQNFLVEFSVF